MNRPATAHPCSAIRGDRRRALGWFGGAALLPLLAATGCSTVPNASSADFAAAALPDAGNRRAAATSIVSSKEATYRFVNRLTWGASDADYQRCREIGTTAWLREQLRATGQGLPAEAQAQIEALSISQKPLTDRHADAEVLRKKGVDAATEDERKAAQQAYQQELNRQVRESANRHLLRAVYSPAQLREQMTWFWFNHFNLHQYKHVIRVLLPDYEDQALRPHALGSFRQMLGAVAKSPAMLQYLDNFQNASGRINENFARELLELHTLGIDGGYTQKDVQELARVLTGHGVNFTEQAPKLSPAQQPQYRRDGFYEFNPARHDFGDKEFLGRTIRGRGAEELDEVLDLLAAHPATARFVSRKMAQFLLADEPPAALVGRMAKAFAGGQIAPAIEVLALSPEFAAAGPMPFKDPMHYVVSAVRAAYADRVLLNTGPMQNWLNMLGEGLYNRQTPDGYPLSADAWNSSGQLATRFDIARSLGSGSAGLFKGADGTAGRERNAFPQLARPMFYDVVAARLSERTRAALDAAPSPQEWNGLLLASPEFMAR